jgi:hypothetical protein
VALASATLSPLTLESFLIFRNIGLHTSVLNCNRPILITPAGALSAPSYSHRRRPSSLAPVPRRVGPLARGSLLRRLFASLPRPLTRGPCPCLTRYCWPAIPPPRRCGRRSPASWIVVETRLELRCTRLFVSSIVILMCCLMYPERNKYSNQSVQSV